MERLSGLDASFLYFETPSTHLHVGGIMVFDPSTSSSGDGSFEWVCDQVNRRLVPHKEFRRRPVRVPFNLHHPVWIEDPHFDLRRHVKRIGAPSPGGMEELAELAGEDDPLATRAYRRIASSLAQSARLDPSPALVARLGPRPDGGCLLYTSPSPRDISGSRMPSSA